ncbi:hypothetical protein EON63_19870 [archaeon]|nr:MAG: hypothetical protein EON63_19870 [archaeon]
MLVNILFQLIFIVLYIVYHVCDLLRSPWRHVLQVVVCVSELYGGWMTFAPGKLAVLVIGGIMRMNCAAQHGSCRVYPVGKGCIWSVHNILLHLFSLPLDLICGDGYLSGRVAGGQSQSERAVPRVALDLPGLHERPVGRRAAGAALGLRCAHHAGMLACVYV